MTTDNDLEHLRLLSVFHYVVGGICGLFSLFPCIHLTFGLALLNGAFDEAIHGQRPPEFIGWIFVFIPLAIILLGMTLAVCIAIAGRCLARRTNYTFCLVVAGIECLFMPIGTVLGVFTIIVLMRPGVQSMFETSGM